jgi:hypothetical protein
MVMSYERAEDWEFCFQPVQFEKGVHVRTRPVGLFICLPHQSVGLVNVPNLTTLCEQNASRNGYLIIIHSVPIYWWGSALLCQTVFPEEE